jgi:hypothetical protein
MGKTYTQDEPVGFTCPKIDAIIESVSEQLKRLRGVREICGPALREELVEELDEVISFLDDLSGRHSPLEEVRDANDKLRGWGNFCVQEFNKLDC